MPVLLCVEPGGGAGTFDRLAPRVAGEVRLRPVPVRRGAAGDPWERAAPALRRAGRDEPFAVAGDGAGAALAVDLAARLLPEGRAARLFLSGARQAAEAPRGTSAARWPLPLPVTIFVPAGRAPAPAEVAWAREVSREVVVRLLDGADPLPRTRPGPYALALREDLGTWDTGGYVWDGFPLD